MSLANGLVGHGFFFFFAVLPLASRLLVFPRPSKRRAPLAVSLSVMNSSQRLSSTCHTRLGLFRGRVSLCNQFFFATSDEWRFIVPC
jgi:hypothetical protein